jgi:hypothetical protein
LEHTLRYIHVRELRLISATTVQAFSFAQMCAQPVWCMPSKMVNGLRVTQPLIKELETLRLHQIQIVFLQSRDANHIAARSHTHREKTGKLETAIGWASTPKTLIDVSKHNGEPNSCAQRSHSPNAGAHMPHAGCRAPQCCSDTTTTVATSRCSTLE